ILHSALCPVRKPTPQASPRVRLPRTYEPEALAYLSAGRGRDYEQLMGKLLRDEGVSEPRGYNGMPAGNLYRESGVAKASEPYMGRTDEDNLPSVGEYGEKL